ncbi:MATE family efflux transporter [uncultured Clostridium sp.]|uniref:MATE family efflux transporter n=1 Tax=uncultured Clostridium sp. TaxID=59620 RepID=UPI0028EE76A4|nr:MATE family efflux transporter [uncultured Clostridium sp.]
MKVREVIEDIMILSIPVMGEMIVYNFANSFELIMIGRFGGNEYVSAITLCNELIDSVYSIFITSGLCIAITSYIARSFGKKDKRSIMDYSFIGVFLGAILSIALCLLLNKSGSKILSLMNAEGKVMDLGISYIKIISLTLIPGIFVHTINAILRGIGDTITPFITSLVICFFKISFYLLLVVGAFPVPVGIKGPALATLISQIAGVFFIIKHLRKNGYIKIFNKKIRLYKIFGFLRGGLSCIFEEGAYSISRLICTGMILSLGSKAFAANQIANTIEAASFMLSISLGVAITTIVGIKVGEGNILMGKKYTYYSCVFAIIISLIFSVIFFLFPFELSKVFINKEEVEVIYYTGMCLLIGAIEQPFIAISSVFSGALKGLGDVKTPFIISTFTAWFIRMPLMYYFIYICKKPVTYVWWITSLQWGVDGILMYFGFKRKANMIQ